MTGAFLGIASVAEAGVVYTDVDPDVTFSSATFDIDLNADRIIDFSVTQSFTDLRVSYYISVAFVGIGGNNSTGFGVVKSGIYADALSSGELIGPGSPIV